MEKVCIREERLINFPPPPGKEFGTSSAVAADFKGSAKKEKWGNHSRSEKNE